MKTWNLTDLYEGFNEKYHADVAALDKMFDDYVAFIRNKDVDDVKYIEGHLSFQEKIAASARTLFSYPSLVMSTDVTNQEAPVYMSKLQQIFRKSTAEDVLFARYLLNVDLDELSSKSPLIKKYRFIKNNFLRHLQLNYEKNYSKFN